MKDRCSRGSCSLGSGGGLLALVRMIALMFLVLSVLPVHSRAGPATHREPAEPSPKQVRPCTGGS